MATRRGPDNSIRFAIAGQNFTANYANVFHAQLTTGTAIIQSDVDAWLNTVQAAYKTDFAPRMNNNVTYKTATATFYAPGGGVIQSSVAMSGAGTSGGSAVLDSSASKVMSWLTSVYWRGGKPRTYLPGLSSSEMLGSAGLQINGTEVTAMQTAGNAFRTAVNAATSGTITGTTFGFISFSSGNVPRSPAVFFPISGAKSHPRIGTQRRRLGKWTV